MNGAAPVAFLVDVDDTLLDNDRIRSTSRGISSSSTDETRYWTIQERRFVELEYRD